MKDRQQRRKDGVSPGVAALAGIGAGFLGWCTLVTFFAPRLRFRMPSVDAESDDFVRWLESACPTRLLQGNAVSILTDGDAFYPAILEAIRAARRTINIEAYVFRPGRVLDAYVDALTERARAGVIVKLVLDAVGASSMRGAPLRRLRDAGCRVCFYDNVTWTLVDRLNNRTHRELVIVDGQTAFTGGPGVADYWRFEVDGQPPWRDTAVRIDGPLVGSLQGVFSENWLEASGEIIAGDAYYPVIEPRGKTPGLVIRSSPADRATVAHMTFYAFISSARRSIDISTPYFVPDQTLREALTAASGRGVHVRLLVPGRHADQPVLHINSRRWYGELLRGGVRVFEYEPAMIHQKLLLVDGHWTVLGTTNMDNRSFELNDEINVAFPNPDLAEAFGAIYARDLARAHEMSLEEWRQRPLTEKAVGRVGWVLDRQQ